jgi:hypothetical protein
LACSGIGSCWVKAFLNCSLDIEFSLRTCQSMIRHHHPKQAFYATTGLTFGSVLLNVKKE